MISLYEGILRGMEETLEIGNVEAAAIAANNNDDIKRVFGVNKWEEGAFSVSEDSGKRVLTVDRNSSHIWVDCAASNVKVSDHLGNIDTIKLIGGATIQDPHNEFAKKICKTIISDTFAVYNTSMLSDVEFRAQPLAKTRYFPGISFDKTVKKITDCRFEVDYGSTSHSRLVFNDIPQFDNVKSDTVRYIDITPLKLRIQGHKDPDVFANPAFKNFFDFGYDLSCSDDNISVKIKDMKGLRKLITSKDFYNREFDMWPYRLKLGTKMTDLIDISEFKSLYTIMIADTKMGIIFENTKAPGLNSCVNNFFIDMLKQTWDPNSPGHGKSSIIDKIPVTADGWRVIIFRR